MSKGCECILTLMAFMLKEQAHSTAHRSRSEYACKHHSQACIGMTAMQVPAILAEHQTLQLMRFHLSIYSGQVTKKVKLEAAKSTTSACALDVRSIKLFFAGTCLEKPGIRPLKYTCQA